MGDCGLNSRSLFVGWAGILVLSLPACVATGLDGAFGPRHPVAQSAAVAESRPPADRGDGRADDDLGAMYERGQGVGQDYAQAVKSHRPAAEQGNALAQLHLGLMYEFGRGVPQDFVQAHQWLNLAAAALPPGGLRETAARHRDGLTRRMTAGQVAQAQESARGFKPAKEAAPPANGANPAPPAATELVRDIQRLLVALGRDAGPEDGTLGAKTRAAIRAFQRDKGLSADGEATAALRASLRAEAEIAAAPGATPRNRELANSGSGFAISRGGHVLTSHHVVDGCAEITARPAGGRSIKAETVARDETNDLALIKIAAASTNAAFRFAQPMRAGDAVVAVGYPLPSLLASEAKISTGSVSALAGMHDDARHLQIAAPVQRGNSGGPLLDSRGHVAGIIVSKLDALKVAGAMGDLPQNVSFALKASVARAFLDNSGATYEIAGNGRELKPAEIGDKAKAFTLQIECWK
jgi:uncharacterized protein